MRKKRKINKGNNTKVAVIFVAFIISIVVITLAFKFILMLSHSQIDDSKRFTIAVSNKTNLEIFSFSPGPSQSGPTLRSLSILKLERNLDKPLGQFLALTINGFVSSETLNLNQNADSFIAGMLLNYKKLDTNLTLGDFIKLFIFSKFLHERDIYTKNITSDLSSGEIDSIVSRLVNDERVVKEGKTIQIINATNVSGLGNRLARLISNMGGDVIIVATANIPHKSSEISYIEDKNYTAELFSEILGFRTVNVSEKKIADITITIGEDSLKSLSF